MLRASLIYRRLLTLVELFSCRVGIPLTHLAWLSWTGDVARGRRSLLLQRVSTHGGYVSCFKSPLLTYMYNYSQLLIMRNGGE